MKIAPDTIARTIVLAIALVNQICAVSGFVPLDIDEETVYQAVSMVATIGASIWSFWKNNSFTQAAIRADAAMKTEKQQAKG